MSSLAGSLSADADSPAFVLGTLVVQTGRFRGVRRDLTTPLTLLGQSPHCEIRLHGAQVAPLHCALIHGPDGFQLRDLGSLSGTYLNNEPILNNPVRHGDLIRVGLFELRLELPSADEPPLSRAALLAGRDAQRVQVAAVVAQQAEMAEEEQRLLEQSGALLRQREQLAGHLDQRRSRLLALQGQIRDERKALEADREAVRQERELVQTGLVEIRAEMQLEKEKLVVQRQRASALSRRLKQRWQKHFQRHEADLRRRERDLASGYGKLESDRVAHQEERAQLVAAQLRFNGEVEIRRRQLQEEWQRLAQAQQQWEASLTQENADRQARLRVLERREAEVDQAEQGLVERRRQAEQLQLRMRRELQGLDVRIRNQREKLVQQEALLAAQKPLLARPDQPSAETEPVTEEPCRSLVVRPESAPSSPGLHGLCGLLADQRRHLVEQWARLLVLQEEWDHDRLTLVGELEAWAGRLAQQHQQIQGRHQRLLDREAELGKQQAMLTEVRCSLEGWHARLTSQEVSAERQRAMALAETQAREEQVRTQLQQLEEAQRQCQQRTEEECALLRQARQQLEEVRRNYFVLWQEGQQRRKAVIQEQCDLATRALALEQLRQQLLAQAGAGPAAERRMERLERRCRARLKAQQRLLTHEQRALESEVARLQERSLQLQIREEAQTRERSQLSRQQAAWEDQHHAARAEVQRLHAELERLRHFQQQDQLHIARLQEELERVASLLLEPAEPPTSTHRAA